MKRAKIELSVMGDLRGPTARPSGIMYDKANKIAYVV